MTSDSFPPYRFDDAQLSLVLSAKLKRGGVWEADVFESPAMARDADGEYRPLMTMIVNQADGLVFSSRLFGRAYPAQDALGDDWLSVIAQSRALPQQLLVREAKIAQALEPLARKLGVEIVEAPLNALSAARRTLASVYEKRRLPNPSRRRRSFSRGRLR
jgi:hypothetical protein